MGEPRLSCGSLSPIPIVRTKQHCRILVTNTENNNISYSYTDLDQLICRNQIAQPQPVNVSRAQPLTLVLASATTAVLLLGLSAGLCIGFSGIEIGLPLTLLGIGVVLSLIFMTVWLYRKCSRQEYQTIPGYVFSESQL